MSDTISRQAAIDAIDRLDIPEDMCVFEILSHIELEIGNLPSAQPEQRWIPCTERLPEKSGRYLVTRGSNVCGSLWDKVDILNYSDLMGLKKEKIWWSGNVGKIDFEKCDHVIAWMPLPEPYKIGKEGKAMFFKKTSKAKLTKREEKIKDYIVNEYGEALYEAEVHNTPETLAREDEANKILRKIFDILRYEEDKDHE